MPPGEDTQESRLDRVHEVLDDALRRRAAGESLADQKIIAAHPDLMPELGEELQSLSMVERLRNLAASPQTCSSAPAAQTGDEADIAASFSEQFPGYDLVGELSHGGQGIVYQAMQRSTKRKVAIKVLLAGRFATRSSRRRFEREIELVAQLKHPGIISIYHSGQTRDGQQYYVMDYVRGKLLHEHVGELKLPLDETLKLFADVCDAVQYAHQRGVIHRDLKPGNILVDADGRPHIFDFGLARQATTPSESLVSVSQQVVGTLPYLSPEQARGNPDEIDTRTDIYALGVTLYELLTGTYPYPVVGNVTEVLRHIAESPPSPLSSVWRVDKGVTKRSSSQVRIGTCPIDAEVQTIITKALAKERERRYQSAGDLGRDIRHYLAGEPIEAKRDSLAYLLRKQLQRYRIAAIAALVILAVVTAGFVTSFAFWRQAVEQRDAAHAAQSAEQRQRRAAEEARSAESAQRRAAQASAEEARLEAAKAAAVSRFLRDMLASVDPSAARGRDVAVRDVLDEAAREIDQGSLRGQPEVEAAVRQTLGETYTGLGELASGRSQLTKAYALRKELLGEEHRDTLETLIALGVTLMEAGEFTDAEARCRHALELCRREFGAEDELTAKAMNNLALLYERQGKYGDSEPLYREALATCRRTLGDDHELTLRVINNLGMLLIEQADYDGALALYREGLEGLRRTLGDDHPITIIMRNNIGWTQVERGHFEDGAQTLRDIADTALRVLGPEHPHYLLARSNLAMALHQEGGRDEAIAILRDVLDACRRTLGDEHPTTLGVLNNLGYVLYEHGEYPEAAECFEVALRASKGKLGDEHAMTLLMASNVARIVADSGDLVRAEALQRRVVEAQRRTLGPDHPDYARALVRLADYLVDQERFDEAEPLFVEGVELCQRALGEDHPDTLTALDLFANLRAGQGRNAEAAELHRQVYERCRERFGEDAAATLRALYSMALRTWEAGNPAEAEPLFREVIAGESDLLGPTHNSTLLSRYCLARVLKDLKKYAESEAVYRALLADQREVLGEDHAKTLETAGQYGILLSELEHWPELEALSRERLALYDRLGDAVNDNAILYAKMDLAIAIRLQDHWADAEPVHRDVLARLKRSPDSDERRTVIWTYNLARVLAELERDDEARPLFEESLNWCEQNLPDDDVTRAIVNGAYGALLSRVGDFEESEKRLLRAYDVLSTAPGCDPERALRTMRGLISLYDAWGKPEQEANWRGALDAAEAENQTSDGQPDE